MDKQSTFKSLVIKTISGDREAFKQLILSQKAAISFQIRSMTEQKNDIEDICQEVVMKVYQSISSLKYPEAFTSWLRTIVARECFKYRKNDNQLVYIEDLPSEVLFKETDEACLPSAHTERLEQSKEITDAIKKLPEVSRNMITMYYSENKSYKNIAEQMDMAIGAVSVNLFRAKRRLRKELNLS